MILSKAGTDYDWHHDERDEQRSVHLPTSDFELGLLHRCR